MQERRALAHGSGRNLFAGDEFPEKRVGVVHKPRGVRKVGHVADYPALRLAAHAKAHALRGEESPRAPILVVRAAVLLENHAVLPNLLLVAGSEQVALRPLVEGAVLEPYLVATAHGLHLAALRDVAKLARIHVDVLGGLREVHHLTAHRAALLLHACTSLVTTSVSAELDETALSRSSRNL